MAPRRATALVAAMALSFLQPLSGFISVSLGSAYARSQCERLQSFALRCVAGDASHRRGRACGIQMSNSRRGQARELDYQRAMTMKQLEFEENLLPLHQDPFLEHVLTAVTAADERKAEDIVAFRVSHLTVITDFMIVLHGNSRPQNQAIALNVIEKMEELHGRTCRQQGTPESGWILLDFGDIIVHVQTEKSRAYYDLEGFWAKGEPIDIGGVVRPNAPTSSSSSSLLPDDWLDGIGAEEDDPEIAAAAAEVDPFWS